VKLPTTKFYEILRVIFELQTDKHLAKLIQKPFLITEQAFIMFRRSTVVRLAYIYDDFIAKVWK